MGPVVAVLLLAGATAVSRVPPRPFAEERQLLDRRLEALRRVLPDGPRPAVDAAIVTEIGRAAGLTVDAVPRAPLENRTHGDVVVDVGFNARFAEVERFFRQLALSPRLADVESLSIQAAAGDLLRAKAVVRFPYRPATAPLTMVPEGVRGSLGAVPKPTADTFLRDQALALAKTEAIATLRRARRNPRLFLAELAAIVRDRPVVLKEAVLAEDFAIRGLVVGQGPMDALEARLERGFFRISDVLVTRSGACYRFEARGRTPVAGVEAELPLPAVEDPFREGDGVCRADRDFGPAVTVRMPVKAAPRPARGARPAPPSAPPPGTLTLRLRDMDAADVMYVLHLLTGRAFVVDQEVRGRLSVETAGMGLDETVTLLGKAGLAASAPGPLRRVTRGSAPPPAPEAPAAEGPRASFALKRARVRDVIDVFNEADPSLGLLAGTGSLGAVSVFASDLPLPLLLSGVRLSARLDEQEEGGRHVLTARPGGPPEGESEPPLALRPDDLVTAEFRLAGVASSGGDWLALAYAPTGTLHAFRKGDRLADGRIADVQSTDVLIQTDEGSIRVGLPDLP
jgi:hypothetical protein